MASLARCSTRIGPPGSRCGPTHGRSERSPPEREIQRFVSEFDRARIPGRLELEAGSTFLAGRRPDRRYERFEDCVCCLVAALVVSGCLLWIPVANLVAAAAVTLALVDTWLEAVRVLADRQTDSEGAEKRFQLSFGPGGVKWESDDDAFWQPVREHFGLS